ncbi:hypothetical protein K502DRAFT_326945 [Neoconidiobolus thromboides FSU 785]|nr:hypothetical protein K502DRAFT_326945 [Neoconidiobolus thromboides FSU 785]
MKNSPFLSNFGSKADSTLAEVVDMSLPEATGSEIMSNHFPKDPQSPNENLTKSNPSTSSKTLDKNFVFWVPAQLHPEIAPNEFNTWLDKRASALSPTEKRATRRKSILSLSSITPEQIEEMKDSLPPLLEPNTSNFSNSLHRRRTLNDSSKRAELLVKKDKDKFIVVPKTETNGLKRSARIKPRKDGTGKGTRRQQSISSELTKPASDEELEKLNHRKAASMTLPTSSSSKQHTPAENSLLSEIASLLSIDLFDSQDKKKDKEPKHSSPLNNIHSSVKSLEAEDVTNLTFTDDPNNVANSKSGLLTSKSNQELSSLVSNKDSILDDDSMSISINRVNSKSSESTLVEPKPNQDSISLAQSSKKNGSTKTAKKGFSWFRNTDSENNEKKINKVEENEEALKAMKQDYKHSKLNAVPKQKPTKHARNKSNNIRDMLGDGISSDVNVNFDSPASKLKNKDKSKKMNFFFLSKDKNKAKVDKARPFPNNKLREDGNETGVQHRLYQPKITLSKSKYDLYDPTDLPLHVEQSLYRLSHQKLSNPKRPLLQQVIISNLMLAYLRVVNPNFRATPIKKNNENIPKPRSPHMLSKDRYKAGRASQLDSSSDEDDLSLSDSSSDDESLSECLNRSRGNSNGSRVI